MLSLWRVTVTAVFACCRPSRLEAAQMAARVGLPLRSSRRGTFSQGQGWRWWGRMREQTHTLGNGNWWVAFPPICYFSARFTGLRRLWGERNEKELCGQGSLKCWNGERCEFIYCRPSQILYNENRYDDFPQKRNMIYKYLYIYMCVSIHIYMYVCILYYTYICMCVYYICIICVYIYVCIICMYINYTYYIIMYNCYIIDI